MPTHLAGRSVVTWKYVRFAKEFSDNEVAEHGCRCLRSDNFRCVHVIAVGGGGAGGYGMSSSSNPGGGGGGGEVIELKRRKLMKKPLFCILFIIIPGAAYGAVATFWDQLIACLQCCF